MPSLDIDEQLADFLSVKSISKNNSTSVITSNSVIRTSKNSKADGNAGLEDLIEMIAELVARSSKMKQLNVKFEADEGAKITSDPSYILNHPFIMYSLLYRRPYKNLKPNFRESFSRDTDKGRQVGSLYAQKMECVVQFDIVACDYKTVNNVMNYFENLMLEGTAYFKSKGVIEVIFQQQLTDKSLENLRDRTSIRSLQYYIIIEKMYTTYDYLMSSTNINNGQLSDI
jgi:hypothetical protein